MVDFPWILTTGTSGGTSDATNRQHHVWSIWADATLSTRLPYYVYGVQDASRYIDWFVRLIATVYIYISCVRMSHSSTTTTGGVDSMMMTSQYGVRNHASNMRVKDSYGVRLVRDATWYSVNCLCTPHNRGSTCVLNNLYSSRCISIITGSKGLSYCSSPNGVNDYNHGYVNTVFGVLRTMADAITI